MVFKRYTVVAVSFGSGITTATKQFMTINKPIIHCSRLVNDIATQEILHSKCLTCININQFLRPKER